MERFEILEQGVCSLSRCPHGALDGVVDFLLDAQLFAFERRLDADPSALVALVGQRVGVPLAAALYKALSTWVRAAVMSWVEPGSTGETHTG